MMKKWLIKDISELTQISTRMLRHYDKIGLLKPSIRQENGYRCYTEQDLTKLQQIIALRYFGFSLSQIKHILQDHTEMYAHLLAQHQFVKQQKEHLHNVDQLLANILKGRTSSMEPDWKDLLLLIEGYNMSEKIREKLKGSWAGQNLTAVQFEEYLFLYEQFPDEFAQRDKIVEDVNQNKLGDPTGPEGQRVAKFMIDLSKKMKAFYLEQTKLGTSMLKSIKTGQLTELDITPEGAQWISRAMLMYIMKQWDALYLEIKNAADTSPKGETGKLIAKKWRELVANQLEAGNKDYLMGILLWQELARQDHEMKALDKPPSPKEMIKPYHLDIFFDPKASAWITEALDAH